MSDQGQPEEGVQQPHAQPWPPGPGADPSQATAPHPARAHSLAMVLLVGGVVLALASALLGGVVGAYLASDRGDSGLGLQPGAGALTRPAGSIASIAAQSLPSVVTLKVKGAGQAGTGSGFVVRKDGYIVTNNHVAAIGGDGGSIVVQFSNGTQVAATIVGRDASYDLAVVKVARTGLPPLQFGASKDVAVGDPVIAVGAPLGLESTVTSGIVSALNRPVTAGESKDQRSYINAIQTDAAINPGNSGGPLLDGAGHVIGVNSAIARIPSTGDAAAGSIGVGFAIPSDQVAKTVEQLIATGKAQHPVIGVLLDQRYEGEGVKIVASAVDGQRPVVSGGPAEKAGLKPGDLIVSMDGKPITDVDEFIVAIRAHSVGDVVVLVVRSGSQERTAKMTLEAARD